MSQYCTRRIAWRTQCQTLLLLSLYFLVTCAKAASENENIKLPADATGEKPMKCPEFALKSAVDYCRIIKQKDQPYGSCHSHIDPEKEYNSCITSVCECNGDKSCGCPAIKAYESQCRNVESDLRVGTIMDECGECYGNGSCKYAECILYNSLPTSFPTIKQKFVTFDCFVHQFQGSCEYVLARDCKGGLFDIHIENDSPVPNAIRSARTRSVAIRAPGLGMIKAIFSYKEATIYINGKRLSWPSTSEGLDGTRVFMFSEEQQNKVEIVLASTRVKITLIDQQQIVVSVPPSFINKTCGLCGNYNGNPDDDLMLPSGDSLSVANLNGFTSSHAVHAFHSFGVNWAAVGEKRLILDANDECTDPKDVAYCDKKLKHRKRVEKFCNIIIHPKGPFADCHAYTNPDWVYRQCVLNGCLHPGNRTMTCSVITSYQTQCQKCDKNFFLSVPQCNQSCSILPAPVNGVKIGYGHSSKDVVRFTCNNGFVLSGSAARRCQANGTWTGTPTVCTDMDECSSGTNNCDSRAVCSNTQGSFTCTCNACYSGNGVTCTRKTCLPLKAPKQGSISSSGNQCEDHVMFECNKGYRLRGSPSLECGTESLWSGRQPICEDIDECSNGNHNCNINALCKNTQGNYTCRCNRRLGYYGNGYTCRYEGCTVNGMVKDASTGKGISNSSVRLGHRRTTTDINGFFSFSGVLCLTYTLSAFGADYVANSKSVTAPRNEESSGAGATVEIVLTRRLTSGTWKIIITWREKPRDVDAYMDVPGGCRVSYYKSERNCFSGSSNVSLDHDDTNAFGLETITIHEGIVGGNYTHYVHVYSEGSTFSSGRVTAELYNGDSKVSTIVSPAGNSKYWDTFVIDTAGRKFYVINRLRKQ